VTMECRLAARLIERVPMQIMLAMNSLAKSVPAETMNISKSGAYFATSLKLREGGKLELRLRIPEEMKSLPPSNANSLAAWRTSSPSVTVACPASASTSPRILLTAPTLASSAAAALFSLSTLLFLLLSSLYPRCSRRPVWKSLFFLFEP
jgi:hypothetical protein